jgi:7,8-dihydroneopterin aldolase/epimerase/oxygenase
MAQKPSTICIAFRRVELRVRIGEHAHEQDPEKPSRLLLDVTLEFDFHDYFEKHGGYVNYDPLRTFLQDLQHKPHINRLEDFARGILSACFAMTPAARVQLSVQKPDIFPEMDGVGVMFDVARADFAP